MPSPRNTETEDTQEEALEDIATEESPEVPAEEEAQAVTEEVSLNLLDSITLQQDTSEPEEISPVQAIESGGNALAVPPSVSTAHIVDKSSVNVTILSLKDIDPPPVTNTFRFEDFKNGKTYRCPLNIAEHLKRRGNAAIVSAD